MWILLFLLIPVASNDRYDELKRQYPKSELYEVKEDKLWNLWYMGSVKALLKAKARSVYEKLPRTEKIVYEECTREAKQLGALALCVVRLLNERDKIKEHLASMPIQPIPSKIVNQTETFTIKVFRKTNSKIGVSSESREHRLSYEEWKKKLIRPQRRTFEKNRKRRRRKRPQISKTMEQDLERFLEITENDENLYHYDTGDDRIPGRPRDKREIDPKKKFDIEKIMKKIPGISAKYFKALFVDSRKDFPSKNLDNLRKIHNHFRKVDVCNDYLKTVNNENQKLLEHMRLRHETPTLSKDEAVLNNVMNVINTFLGAPSSDDKFSLLSPKLLSIFPESESQKTRPHLLSPTVLSFHDDGFFTMNEVLKAASGTEKSKQVILDAVLEASGASEMLDQVIGNMTDEIREMDENKFPLVREMSRLDLGHLRAHRTMSGDQLNEYEQKGYTFLEKEQLDHIYGSGSNLVGSPRVNMTAYLAMGKEAKEAVLEAEIRQMARIYQNHLAGKKARRKRQIDHGETDHGNGTTPVDPGHEGEPVDPGHEDHGGTGHEEGHHGGHGGVEFITLSPTAFSNFINHGVAMEVVTLSPRFWVAEILAPEALIVQTLSPRAFIGTVLSPNALIARTLSPTAFRAEILAPRALTSWVLSPEAFVVEVLSPRFLEPRVLSPEAMVIDILSPGFLAPHFMSDEVVGVMVLSPNVLSPRIESHEKMLVEILSPHILGGPHSHEEKEHHGVIEDRAGEHAGRTDPFNELGPNGVHGGTHHPHEHTAPHANGVHQFVPQLFPQPIQPIFG